MTSSGCVVLIKRFPRKSAGANEDATAACVAFKSQEAICMINIIKHTWAFCAIEVGRAATSAQLGTPWFNTFKSVCQCDMHCART